MGSGKTTLGPLIAERLGWTFVDLDDAIEEEDGRKIPRIFSEEGEEGFREIEQRVAEGHLRREDIVIASGGGWPCRVGRLEGLPEGTLSIWLVVSPERSLERVRSHSVERPLLAVGDPLRRIQELLAEREPYYRLAHWSVDSELHPPVETARRIAERIAGTWGGLSEADVES